MRGRDQPRPRPQRDAQDTDCKLIVHNNARAHPRYGLNVFLDQINLLVSENSVYTYSHSAYIALPYLYSNTNSQSPRKVTSFTRGWLNKLMQSNVKYPR